MTKNISFPAFVRENRDKILTWSVITSYAFTMIPSTLTFVVMLNVYTVFEALLPLSFMIISTGAFSIAFISTWKRTSTFYLWLYFGFNALLGSVFTLLAPYYAAFVAWMVYSMVQAVKATHRGRKFMPRFRTARAWILVGISLGALATPLLIGFYPPAVHYTVAPEPGMEGKTIELNFALANASIMESDMLALLDACNALPGINISLEMPIVETFIMNGTRFLGRPVPERNEYVSSFSAYLANYSVEEARSRYRADMQRYNDAIYGYAHDLRLVFDNMTYEELDALQASDFALEGLIANQTRELAALGIAVDYMPLLEFEIYVNDYTIQRINKTLVLFKKFVELGNLQTAHRGLIVDTEFLWGKNQLELIPEFYNFPLHDAGLVNLGKMVRMAKEWEWEWKGGKAAHGDFTEAKWRQHMVDAKVSYVGSATFGMHLDDLWDHDDAQQNFFKISIVTAKEDSQFDMIGIMTYEKGRNSEEAVYSYCKGGDYFFGESNVPYIYSGIDNIRDYQNGTVNGTITYDTKRYVNEITRKFLIARNYGYKQMGIWAFTHMYCYSEIDEGWCGGFYDFLRDCGDPWDLYRMCQNISTYNESITFTCDAMNFAFAHPGLTFLDAYLIGNFRYGAWPINNNERIRPDDFTPEFVLWIIGIGTSAGIILTAMLIYKNARRKQENG